MSLPTSIPKWTPPQYEKTVCKTCGVELDKHSGNCLNWFADEDKREFYCREHMSIRRAEVRKEQDAQMAARRAEQDAKREAEKAEKERKDAEQLKASVNNFESLDRKGQNAVLNAHGYTWQKMTSADYAGGHDDDPGYHWELKTPDGRWDISVRQAIDEIRRGKDVVLAEIAVKNEAARKERQQQENEKREAERKINAAISDFDKQVAAIRAETQETEQFDTTGFERITQPIYEGVKSISYHRRHDEIKRGRINGITCYFINHHTGYDDDGRYEYRSVDPVKAGLAAK